jgi:hypothetical protein
MWARIIGPPPRSGNAAQRCLNAGLRF